MSANFNRALFVGNLTADAEIKTSGDKSFATGTIAVNRSKDEVEFIDFTANEKLAQYLTKGKTIGLSGGVTAQGYAKGDGSIGASLKLIRPEVSLGSFAEHVIVGRITADAVIRDGNEGTQFATFSVAVNTGNKENQTTTYYDCTANVGTVLPEQLRDALVKGLEVVVFGSNLKARAYTDNSGEAKASLSLSARRIQLGAKPGNEGEAAAPAAATGGFAPPDSFSV